MLQSIPDVDRFGTRGQRYSKRLLHALGLSLIWILRTVEWKTNADESCIRISKEHSLLMLSLKLFAIGHGGIQSSDDVTW